MRIIKRWFRNKYADYRIGKRLEIIRKELSKQLDGKIDLVKSGSRGQDSIYFVLVDHRKKAVLRLVNPFRKNKQVDKRMPYQLPPPEIRLQREWENYQAGFAAGLTPKPLWHCEDALLCEYVPLQKMHDRLLLNPDEFWHLVTRATYGLSKLHACGLIHMDASLANILADDDLEKFIFIDFEFFPNITLARQQQIAYDYLRLLESSYKFMPAYLNSGYNVWLECLIANSALDFKSTDLSPLLPALERLRSDQDLWPAIQKLFTGLD